MPTLIAFLASILVFTNLPDGIRAQQLALDRKVLARNESPHERVPGTNSPTTENRIKSDGETTSNPPPIQQTNYVPPLTFREVFLSVLVLIFGLIILGLQQLLLRKRPDRIDPEGILVLHAVTLIVIGTLFLICSGLSERQIAPAMGLFGTIIGYILGKRSEQEARSRGEGSKT